MEPFEHFIAFMFKQNFLNSQKESETCSIISIISNIQAFSFIKKIVYVYDQKQGCQNRPLTYTRNNSLKLTVRWVCSCFVFISKIGAKKSEKLLFTKACKKGVYSRSWKITGGRECRVSRWILLKREQFPPFWDVFKILEGDNIFSVFQPANTQPFSQTAW